MKEQIFIILVSFLSINIYCQTETESFLTAEKYLINPVAYLLNLDNSKIETGILIDRALYDATVFQYNGISQVTTSYEREWLESFFTFKYSLSDTSYFPSYNFVKETNKWYNKSHIYPISVLDIDFNRITEAALANDEFIQEVDYLSDYNANASSYSTHRFISASVLNEYIYGDNISFVLPQSLYLSNRQDWELYEVEVDFGNGAGFQPIFFDQPINIQYNSTSENIMVKVKIVSDNLNDNSKDTVYSHFTFFRKGSDIVPSPDNINQSTLKSAVPNPDIDAYYPVGTPITIRICHPCGRYGTCCEDRIVMSGRKISYYIIFNPSNPSNNTKLRRPFIVCDGFDPGDSKDYYSSSSEEVDGRGMYEILNGDPSKNEVDPDRPSANLVSKLQSRGYDLVFVNYLSGAGDIPSNAEVLRGFLNDVVNDEYRDENTEEAILVGPSMGGLITRYALAKMEEEGEEHYVRQWISFDSPHKGANVSLGFQWLIYYFSQIHVGGPSGIWPFNKLASAKEQFADIISMIDLPAAKQMVLQHYSQLGGEEEITDNGWYENGDHMSVGYHPDFQTFYSEIEALNNDKGFPVLPKRYAVSNGGKSKRYDEDGAEIAKFKILNWTYAYAYGNHNTNGDFKIFDGHRQDDAFDGDGTNDNDYSLYTASQIGYENAPGGGYAMNGLLNHKEENKFDVPKTAQYKYFTFMPTPTTFGVEVTRSNVYKTWDQFEANNTTPFDYVQGMPDNEEHVQITANTANEIVINDILEDDFNNSVKPYNRSGENNIQNVSGKVSYKAGNSITFAGNGNEFNVKNGAKVDVKSGNSITFLPGFSVEKGAEFSASVEPVSLNQSSLKSASIGERKSIDYSKPLKYKHKIYDYSKLDNQIFSPEEITPLSIMLYPNPSSHNIYILINTAFDIAKKSCSYEIINMQGQTVLNGKVANHQNNVDISSLIKGIYLVKISSDEKILTEQFIKN
jgi:hypothetical protein